MLELIDQGLEGFFRASVPLSATDVDVSFEAPDREWSAKLTRPTVNVFLWDIRRSADRSRGGLQTVVRDGARVHQLALPVVELRYVVTTWTSDIQDERALLAGLMRALLAYGSIPREFLPDDFEHLDEPTLLMARAGEDHMDVFKALEGKVKPGLNIVLTTEFDTGSARPAGPPVESIGISMGRLDGPRDIRRRVAGQVADAEAIQAIGALAYTDGDSTVINSAGQFLLRAEPGAEVIVETDPPLSAIVPETGGLYFEHRPDD